MLSNIIDRVKLPFRKDKELYLALYKIMGFYPHKITYYKVALMHKSLGHRATAEELKVLEGKKGKKKDGYQLAKNDILHCKGLITIFQTFVGLSCIRRIRTILCIPKGENWYQCAEVKRK